MGAQCYEGDVKMSLYEIFKDKYKRTSYPLMDEHQFDELVTEIRAESAERIKELEEANKRTQKHREEVESSESNIRQEMFKLKSRIRDLEEKLSNAIASRDSFKELYYHEKNSYELIVKGDISKKDERIKELEAAISKMETTSPKWISTKDSLPKEGEEVIVFYTSWKHEYQQVAIFESGEFIDLGGCALSPTHWMPLPPPPITKEI